MFSLFARDRFGKPQLIAIGFLLVFMALSVWRMADMALTGQELAAIRMGNAMWQGETAPMIGSRVVAMPASAGAALGNTLDAMAGSGDIFLRCGARLPFLGVALLLGASLWYVARRLYGNTGGYIALALYCFTPMFVRWGAEVNSYIVISWGVFGIVFGAIASAHTLYAPLTWKQRAPRAVLLGTAIGLAIAATPAMLAILPLSLAFMVLPLALAFMLYLAPGKRLAAMAVFGASVAAALFLLLALWFFDAAALWQSFSYMSQAAFPRGSSFVRSIEILLSWFGEAWREGVHPALFALLLLSLVSYAGWKRARYFGNTAPLVTMVFFLLAGLASASPLLLVELLLVTLPFLFVFIAGVFADLLETRRRKPVLAILVALLVVHAAYGLAESGFSYVIPGF